MKARKRAKVKGKLTNPDRLLLYILNRGGNIQDYLKEPEKPRSWPFKVGTKELSKQFIKDEKGKRILNHNRLKEFRPFLNHMPYNYWKVREDEAAFAKILKYFHEKGLFPALIKTRYFGWAAYIYGSRLLKRKLKLKISDAAKFFMIASRDFPSFLTYLIEGKKNGGAKAIVNKLKKGYKMGDSSILLFFAMCSNVSNTLEKGEFSTMGEMVLEETLARVFGKPIPSLEESEMTPEEEEREIERIFMLEHEEGELEMTPKEEDKEIEQILMQDNIKQEGGNRKLAIGKN